MLSCISGVHLAMESDSDAGKGQNATAALSGSAKIQLLSDFDQMQPTKAASGISGFSRSCEEGNLVGGSHHRLLEGPR